MLVPETGSRGYDALACEFEKRQPMIAVFWTSSGCKSTACFAVCTGIFGFRMQCRYRICVADGHGALSVAGFVHTYPTHLNLGRTQRASGKTWSVSN